MSYTQQTRTNDAPDAQQADFAITLCEPWLKAQGMVSLITLPGGGRLVIKCPSAKPRKLAEKSLKNIPEN